MLANALCIASPIPVHREPNWARAINDCRFACGWHATSRAKSDSGSLKATTVQGIQTERIHRQTLIHLKLFSQGSSPGISGPRNSNSRRRRHRTCVPRIRSDCRSRTSGRVGSQNDDPVAAAQFESTQGEWEVEKGENTSYHSECGPRCPVEMVSWEGVRQFIRSLNERESGHSYRYRLPPEAEREYAARGHGGGAIRGVGRGRVVLGQQWPEPASSGPQAGECVGLARHAQTT